MEKKEKGKTLLIDVIEKIVIIFIIILFGCFSYYYLKSAFNNKYEEIIEYKSNSNGTNYKVYLLENQFFDEPYLDMNKKYYISNLIDYIDINYNYNLSFSDFVSGEYSYYVKGIVSADTPKDDDSNYWSKTYILSEKEKVTFDKTNSFNINTNVKVDYQEYNKILNDFKKEYGIAFDGVFKVQLVVESISKGEKITKTIPVDSLVEINIPLTQQIIDVEIDLSEIDETGKVSEMLEDKGRSHWVLLGMGLLFGVLTIFLIIYLFRCIRKALIKRSAYVKELKKILNAYDSIIVNTSALPKVDDLNVIEVSSFSELIDAHSEVRMPINYLEEEPDYKSIFLLISDKIAWKYTLINEEYEKYFAKKRKKKNKTKKTKTDEKSKAVENETTTKATTEKDKVSEKSKVVEKNKVDEKNKTVEDKKTTENEKQSKK